MFLMILCAMCVGRGYGSRHDHVPAAIVCLTKAIRTDPDVYTRAAAATGLGKSGDARATKPLVDALADTNPLVRTAAAEALGLRGIRARVPVSLSWQRRMMRRVCARPHAPRLGDALRRSLPGAR